MRGRQQRRRRQHRRRRPDGQMNSMEKFADRDGDGDVVERIRCSVVYANGRLDGAQVRARVIQCFTGGFCQWPCRRLSHSFLFCASDNHIITFLLHSNNFISATFRRNALVSLATPPTSIPAVLKCRIVAAHRRIVKNGRERKSWAWCTGRGE